MNDQERTALENAITARLDTLAEQFDDATFRAKDGEPHFWDVRERLEKERSCLLDAASLIRTQWPIVVA